MSRNLNSRLQKLERKTSTDEAIVRQWEHAGRLYSELDEGERRLYCKYWAFDIGTFEEIHHRIGGNLDFPVFAEQRYSPETWREKCAEIEAYMTEEIDKNERM